MANLAVAGGAWPGKGGAAHVAFASVDYLTFTYDIRLDVAVQVDLTM